MSVCILYIYIESYSYQSFHFQYLEMYKRSVEDPAGFWSDMASQFFWKQRWGDQVYSENLDVSKGPIKIEVCFSLLFLLFFPSTFSLLHPLTFLFNSFLNSGSRAVSPTFPTIAWIEMLKLDLATKLPFTGKAMSLVLMPL